MRLKEPNRAAPGSRWRAAQPVVLLCSHKAGSAAQWLYNSQLFHDTLLESSRSPEEKRTPTPFSMTLENACAPKLTYKVWKHERVLRIAFTLLRLGRVVAWGWGSKATSSHTPSKNPLKFSATGGIKNHRDRVGHEWKQDWRLRRAGQTLPGFPLPPPQPEIWGGKGEAANHGGIE